MSQLLKKLIEFVSNKRYIRFAILGLPQSGKTHFINILRNEPYDPKQTSMNGETIQKKEIKVEDKTLVLKRTRDINGLNKSEYERLIRISDVIYFFFRADYFLHDKSLSDVDCFPEEETKKYNGYRAITIADFGSIIQDKNAKKKPIIIVASFKKKIKEMKENVVIAVIKKAFEANITNADFHNCHWFVADIDDDHRGEVVDNTKELILNIY